jgi:hypothetical protein
MRRNGDFSQWIAAGIAFALGFLIFKLLIVLIVAVVAFFWFWTEFWRPAVRSLARGIFVTLGILGLLVGLALLIGQ